MAVTVLFFNILTYSVLTFCPSANMKESNFQVEALIGKIPLLPVILWWWWRWLLAEEESSNFVRGKSYRRDAENSTVDLASSWIWILVANGKVTNPTFRILENIPTYRTAILRRKISSLSDHMFPTSIKHLSLHPSNNARVRTVNNITNYFSVPLWKYTACQPIWSQGRKSNKIKTSLKVQVPVSYSLKYLRTPVQKKIEMFMLITELLGKVDV